MLRAGPFDVAAPLTPAESRAAEPVCRLCEAEDAHWLPVATCLPVPPEGWPLQPQSREPGTRTTLSVRTLVPRVPGCGVRHLSAGPVWFWRADHLLVHSFHLETSPASFQAGTPDVSTSGVEWPDLTQPAEPLSSRSRPWVAAGDSPVSCSCVF